MAETDVENAIKIAVLGEQIDGIRQQHKAHSHSTQTRFDGIENKIDDLTAIMNRGKGAYAASMALSAGIGAVILTVISTVGSFFHK